MSKFTRRTFVRRGTATLGTVLGLGLLPSLTRKLHATDESSPPVVPNGLKFDYAGDGTASRTETFHGGTLTISIAFTCSPAKGVCSTVGLMSVLRQASFSITLSGVFYKGTAVDLSLVTWQVVDGVPRVTSVTHPNPPTTAMDVAIANPNNTNETVGTLFTLGSRGSDPYVSFTAMVFLGDEYSPQYKLGPIQYTATACTVA